MCDQDQETPPDNTAAASTQAQEEDEDDYWPYEHSREEEAQIAAVLDEEIAELKALKQTTPAELRQTVLDMQAELIRLQYAEQQAGIEPEMLEYTPNPEEPLTINFAGMLLSCLLRASHAPRRSKPANIPMHLYVAAKCLSKQLVSAPIATCLMTP